MGEAIEKLSGRLGVDTTDFKTNIAAANRELRLLESSFRSNVASLGDWSKSSVGLEERIKSLTDQIDIQKLKVAALRENYEKIKGEQGENSRAAKEAEIALNKQTETLGKMQAELSASEQALDDLSQAEDDAGSSADEASEKVNRLGSTIDLMGGIAKGTVTVILSMVTAVLALTAGISGLVFSTANASAEISDLSLKTGISVERLQELSYIGDQVGTSQETITSSLARLIRTMGSAQQQYADFAEKQAEAAANGEEFDGTLGDSAAAFERLGVSITDTQGNLRDNEAVFADVINALGKINNEAERDALSMSIFGKSAQELNPLIKAGTAEMERLAAEAHEVGAVISEENVAAFEAFDDTLASLQAGVKGTIGTLVAAFLPGFESVFDRAGSYLRDFAGIVKTSDGDFGALADGLGGLLAKIIGDIASQGPQMLQTGLNILQGIIDSIVANLPTLINAAIGIITMLLNFIVQNLPTIISAGLLILIALVNGISTALPSLIPAVVQAVITIVQTIANNLPLLISAALQLILALAQGLIIALPILIEALPQVIYTILNALVGALPQIFDAAGQLVGMLAYGILASIPVLLAAIAELIVGLGNVLANYINTMPDLGKNLIMGLANGIRSATGLLYDAVTNMVNGMVQRIKDLLGMHSPSDTGIDIGGNLVRSIGLGGEEEAPKVRLALTRQMTGIVNAMSSVPASMVGTSGVIGGVGSITIGDIIINIPGSTATPQQIAIAAQDGVIKALRSKGAA